MQSSLFSSMIPDVVMGILSLVIPPQRTRDDDPKKDGHRGGYRKGDGITPIIVVDMVVVGFSMMEHGLRYFHGWMEPSL